VDRERRSRGNEWGKVRKSGGYTSGLFKKGIKQSVEKPPVTKSTPETSQREQSGQRGKDTRGTGELSCTVL